MTLNQSFTRDLADAIRSHAPLPQFPKGVSLEQLLDASGVAKSFGAVRALTEAELRVDEGEGTSEEEAPITLRLSE